MKPSDLKKNTEYNKLKKRWKNEMMQGNGDGFCAIYSESGPPMSSGVYVPICWSDSKNALAHLRFGIIPFQLAWECDRAHLINISDAEEYLPLLTEEQIKYVQNLLQLIDKALLSEKISSSMLESIRTEFNNTFSYFPNCSEIEAWGGLVEVFTSPEASWLFDEDDEREMELKNLFDTKKFNKNNKEHMELLDLLFEHNQPG